MKKLYRSAMFAGVLAIGVAACGDDVTITEAPAPPPPPLQVTMSPSNQAILVGESAVFAVGISGGEAGAQASHTCASSATAVATVSTVAAGCQVTGVAAGNASITVTVTKGSQSASAGGQVAVSAPVVPTEPTVTPATVTIANISAPVNAVAGTVNVTLNVNPNDSKVTKVALSIAGVEVASQTFAAGTFGEGEDAARTTQQVIFQVNTTEAGVAFILDDDPGTATVVFTNGEHPLTASVFSEGSEAAGTATLNITLANADTMIVEHALAEGFASALDDAGEVWYKGDIIVTAYPILFSGKVAKDVEFRVLEGAATARSINIARGTATLPTSLETAGTVTTLSAAPYRVTFRSDYDSLNKLSARPVDGDTIRALTGFQGSDVGGAATLKNFVGGGVPSGDLALEARVATSTRIDFDNLGPAGGIATFGVNRPLGWAIPNWDFRRNSAVASTSFSSDLLFSQSSNSTLDPGVGMDLPVSLPTSSSTTAAERRALSEAQVQIYAATSLTDRATWTEIETAADMGATTSLNKFIVICAEDRLENSSCYVQQRNAASGVTPASTAASVRLEGTYNISAALTAPLSRSFGADLTTPALRVLGPDTTASIVGNGVFLAPNLGRLLILSSSTATGDIGGASSTSLVFGGSLGFNVGSPTAADLGPSGAPADSMFSYQVSRDAPGIAQTARCVIGGPSTSTAPCAGFELFDQTSPYVLGASTASEGTYTLTWRIRNAAGSSATASRTVLVDGTVPTAAVPTAVTVVNSAIATTSGGGTGSSFSASALVSDNIGLEAGGFVVVYESATSTQIRWTGLTALSGLAQALNSGSLGYRSIALTGFNATSAQLNAATTTGPFMASHIGAFAYDGAFNYSASSTAAIAGLTAVNSTTNSFWEIAGATKTFTIANGPTVANPTSVCSPSPLRSCLANQSVTLTGSYAITGTGVTSIDYTYTLGTQALLVRYSAGNALLNGGATWQAYSTPSSTGSATATRVFSTTFTAPANLVTTAAGGGTIEYTFAVISPRGDVLLGPVGSLAITRPVTTF